MPTELPQLIREEMQTSQLVFPGITPVAPRGLGGLVRDHFSNGRLFAAVGWHGGLVNVAYWGNQHLGAREFFSVGLESAWWKLFRTCVWLGSECYYLPWETAKLYPFGMGGHAQVSGASLAQELLLLPDALVQRIGVLKNPKRVPVGIEMFHMEKVARKSVANREWSDFEISPKLNAMICSCTDTNPAAVNDKSLAQQGLALKVKDAPRATTWIGIGCDASMTARRSHNGFKLYFKSEASRGRRVAFFVVFATSRPKLEVRLAELSKSVHEECDRLLAGYEKRLLTRPGIDVADPVLNSAFGQYPEVVEFTKIPDRAGAVRATQAGYFVWGWDGMTPILSSALANEPEYAADILRFFQSSWHPRIGIPLAFTSTFQAKLKEPFPAQAQFIAALYHYVATTGDLALAKEMMPTCRRILDRCRKDIVQNTGLVSGNAVWPDHPEAMGENGHDISSMNNSCLYQGLRAMEYLAAALGDARLAVECRDWAARLRSSIIRYLYDQEHGFFITSCSSQDLSPRKHYACQTIFWLTPFARELVSHAPGRIAAFMGKHLRSARCFLSLPRWDTAWMADGNQLGSSFPIADYFYLGVHKLLEDDSGLKTWLGDVQWFWKYHTAPEAFTPEVENEDEFGPDNHGCKQMQAVTCWYASVYFAVAGMDFDHEGITLTPWGNIPVKIRGLRLRGISIDLVISGRGWHIQSLKLNGKKLPTGSRKIFWKQLSGKSARIAVVRTEKPPNHPVIVRADGLRITELQTKLGYLRGTIDGKMTGEIVIQAGAGAIVSVDDQPLQVAREPATGTLSIPFTSNGPAHICIREGGVS